LDLKGQVKNTFFAVKLGGAFMMRIYNIIEEVPMKLANLSASIPLTPQRKHCVIL
ncbi:hypothetical protein BAZOLSSOX_1169, partial [uncultured Gammaproteobacteria bacterium]